MWIVCLADDWREIANLIFSEKEEEEEEKKIKVWSTVVVISDIKLKKNKETTTVPDKILQNFVKIV